MSKKRNKQTTSRRDNSTKVSTIQLVSGAEWDSLCATGYTRLDQIPAIVAGYRKIAEAIGSMTIHLMENTDDGDVRINNELSRKIDIDPTPYMTRSGWMEYIVMTMLLYGKGNATVRVKTLGGLLEDLQPIPADRVQYVQDATGYSYKIAIDGRTYNPDELLHFVYNPDKHYPWKGQGVTASLKDVASCLRQAQETERGFMESKWKPSLIVKVDGLVDAFADQKGRDKLIDQYIGNSEAGKPWIVPADALEIQEVRPLSLSDIALNDSVTLDTKKVASLIGVPSFVLGVGDYNQKEWNNFVQTKIRTLALNISQELTRKLILNPKWYLRFNSLSLMDYDISTVSSVFVNLHDRGIVNGNEVRDQIGLSPVDGLNERKILENFIPIDMSGNQKKLIQEDE